MSKVIIVLMVISLGLIALLPVATSAEWNGEAELRTTTVRVNFMERFEVVIRNDGPDPIEIVSVAVTVQWEGMTTLYQVFEGSAILSPGESREFIGPPTRMPNVAVGRYSCFVGVEVRGTDGAMSEKRYPSTISAVQVSVSPQGVPEELFFPLLLTACSLLVTLLLFRFERRKGWPLLRAVPRWDHHQ